MRDQSRGLAFACALVLLHPTFSNGLDVVVGATGGCGRHVVAHLVTRGFAVRAVVRDLATAAFPSAVEVVRGDVTDEYSLRDALVGGVERVVVATGRRGPASSSETVDFVGMKNLLAAVRAAATVQKLVLISSGLVTRPGAPINLLLNWMGNMVLGWKLEAEKELRRSGVPYVVVRPMGLSDDAQGDAAPVIDQGDRFGMGRVDRTVVARAVVEALEHAPEGTTFELKQDVAAGSLDAFDWASALGALRPDEPTALTLRDHETALRWAQMAWRVGAVVLGGGAALVAHCCCRRSGRRFTLDPTNVEYRAKPKAE